MSYVRFSVIGRGSFPVDMLRYDQCFPRDGNSAEALMDRDFTGEPKAGFRTVELVCRSPESWNHPTILRWSSFGWSVIPDSIIRGE